MPKIGNIEIPDTQIAVNIEINPAGATLHRALINQRGQKVSHKVLPLDWATLAALVDEKGREVVPEGPKVVS